MHSCFVDVPAYAAHQQAIGSYFFDRDVDTSIPLLEKADVLASFPSAYMTDVLRNALENGEVEYAATSGSTSDRLQLVRPRNWWIPEFERGYNCNSAMYGFSMHTHRKASLTTAVCSGNTCFLNEPEYHERIAGNTLYLNTTIDPNTWTRDDVLRIDDELHKFSPALLEVDPVYLAIFLRKRHEMGLAEKPYQPAFITASFEFMTAAVRAFIESEYECPVFSLFGSTELGVLFVQEADGGLRRCPRFNILELHPVIEEKNIFELVVTSWKNELMPLLRYRSGDLVELHPLAPRTPKYFEHEPLSIRALHGRRLDACTTAQGELVTVAMLDEAVRLSGWSALQYQLEFAGPQLTVRYVDDAVNVASVGRHTAPDFLQDWFGAGHEIRFQKVKAIRPQASGKFSIVKQMSGRSV